MTLRIGTNNSQAARGFTLIELILMMALLMVAVSLVMPAMSRFFGTRDVDSETRRFMALMHYGRTRAVSEGVPTMLWVDSDARTYGLELEPGYADKDIRAVENKLADGLTIGIAKSTSARAAKQANSQTGRILSGQATGSKVKLPAIFFSPDGSINEARSVAGISIQHGDDAPRWIAPSGGEVSDELQRQKPTVARR
jgi:Tfp pilus assembly protein FimT